MKYVSIDLETTGLDPENDQVIMAALVIEDTDKRDVPVESLPFFYCLVEHPRYSGDAFALAMNHKILSALSKVSEEGFATLGDLDIPVYDDCWEYEANEFLCHYLGAGKVIAAGKNAAGFDLKFLRALRSKFAHRVIDPGSVFLDFNAEKIPSLDDLKKRFQIPGAVTHDALDDARDVIRVLRQAYSPRAVFTLDGEVVK